MTKQVLEIFKSLQGEGQHIGIPSIFIRFAKCNLTCPHCDTKFSWTEEPKYNINDVIKYIEENNKYQHIVFTGGEPLLYQDEIIRIIAKFGMDKLYTVETNATIMPNALLADRMSWSGLWSVSPKLHLWGKSDIATKIVGWNSYRNSQFKFVITNPEDFDKIKFIIDTKMITQPLIIQPNGHRQDYDIACRELADWVNEHQYINIRVLPQFHRLCWGQCRGI